MQKGQNSGSSHLYTTYIIDRKQNHWVFFPSKPGSSQQPSSYLPLSTIPAPPPTPLATNVIRMKILKIPPGVMGREPQSRVPQSHACSATQRGAWPLPAGGLKEMTSSGTCDRTMFFLHLYRELSSCCHSLVRFCTTRFIILASTKESAFKIQILKNNLE